MPHFSTVCGSWFKPRGKQKPIISIYFPASPGPMKPSSTHPPWPVPRVHANLHLDLPESWQCPGIDLSISTTCLSSTCPITSPPKSESNQLFEAPWILFFGHSLTPMPTPLPSLPCPPRLFMADPTWKLWHPAIGATRTSWERWFMNFYEMKKKKTKGSFTNLFLSPYLNWRSDELVYQSK